MSYLVFDLETTIHSSYKRKGNPFDPLNHVVMVGWQYKAGPVESTYYGHTRPADGWLVPLLQRPGLQLIVGHNIKFDILHAIHRNPKNLAAWQAWVAKGGNVWDTQLAEYLLNGCEKNSHMLALDEVAPVYGGNIKFDEVKALWAAGVNTPDIDRNILTRYLCGYTDEHGQYSHGDIGNTEIIFLGQLRRAREAKQIKSILLNMGSLLCTIEMERNGMAVDKALGIEIAAKLAARLEVLRAELNTFLPEGLPFEFKWSSRQQLSALIFGGKVKYPVRVHQTDEAGELAYAQKKEAHYLLNDGTTTADAPTSDTLINYAVFKGGKNAGELKTKQVTIPDPDKPKLKWEDFYYEFPRMTEPKPEWQGATEGVYSVGAEVIKELGNRNIPFLKQLSEVTGLAKDLGTYFITTDEETGESKGMLTLVQEDGIIHHSLNHTSTVTGRFSSSNPNLQNIPKGGKSDVKLVFVSRFNGGKIIQSDFTALEVYVQAILTNCRQLIEDLKAGLDMHCVRVAQKEGMDYAEVYRLAKVEGVPEWDTKRTKAKVFSFQRAYGAGAAKISESTGMPLEEVEALIKAETERYPEIDAYYELVTAAIKRNRRATSKFIPHPTLRGAMCQIGKSHFITPDNKRYSYEEQPSPEYLAKRGHMASFSPTEIKNFIVQGLGAEWMKAAMWTMVREWYKRGNFGGRSLLVNTVHDASYLDVAPELAEESAALLHACMEGANEVIRRWFGMAVQVPVPSDTVMGNNMMEENKLAPEVFTRAKALRDELWWNALPALDTGSTTNLNYGTGP